jgi:hypothetical protein
MTSKIEINTLVHEANSRTDGSTEYLVEYTYMSRGDEVVETAKFCKSLTEAADYIKSEEFAQTLEWANGTYE